MALLQVLPSKVALSQPPRLEASSRHDRGYCIRNRRRNVLGSWNYHAALRHIQNLHCLTGKRKFQLACRNRSSGPCLETTMSKVSLQDSDTAKKAAAWQEFARNVSGEWDGYAADFSPEGRPIELPESVVPEAFREWEVTVYDWQTQCPTIADENAFSVRYRSIKLLPTVGCEADAATRYSEDQRQVGGINNGVTSFAYHSSGCYLAVWHGKKFPESKMSNFKSTAFNHEQSSELEVEYCLVQGKHDSRIRIIQLIDIQENSEKQEMQGTLKQVTMHSEQWYGPFRDGEHHGGCSISSAAFASENPLNNLQISGIWKSQTFVAECETKPALFNEFAKDRITNVTRDLNGVLALPKNLWCRLNVTGNNEILSEVGWLWDTDSMTTLSSEVSVDGKLKKAILCLEHR